MANDLDIGQLDFIPASIARGLADLQIRTARQLFHRLKNDRPALASYLEVGAEILAQIEKKLHAVIEREFPHELVRQVTPAISKRGVAAHRVEEEKSKYYDAEVYVSPNRRH